ncbi:MULTISPECIES: DMT family transporter [Vibrio]|uniref:EamA domain-containing protein n=1 Tax=Vibrio bivalvicida TaxID=1276888 RepID=A0A177Y1S3_9VIBR|nr:MULTISPECIES: DMT family transporter [Vibrio]KLN63984.1 membrane protein [Vibrio sp. VPAP30]OAJ94771.1 hypothetical protein APB76_05675 [Vibrio bivalvicida]
MSVTQQTINKAKSHPLLEHFSHSLSPVNKGILLALISTALFVIVGVLVRTLSERIDPFQILLFRQVVFVILLFPVIASNIKVLIRPNKVGLHLLRVSGAFVALYFGFLTVSGLPFADATALGFVQVLFVALVSKVFLSETIGFNRVFTIVAGFVGVMLVVQPTFEDANFAYVMFGIVASFGASIAVICVRKVAQTEPKITLLSYQAIFVGLIALVPALYAWVWPTLPDLMLLVLVGLISSVAQWFGVSAYKWAEANVVANVEYVKIIYSLVIGFFLFSEVPDAFAILGSLIILLSAIIPTFISKRILSNSKF